MRMKILVTAIIALLLVSSAAAVTVSMTNNGDGTTTISIRGPTTLMIELRDALCHNYGYEEMILNPDGTTTPNPQTCAQFGLHKWFGFFKENIHAYRVYQWEQSKPTANDITET